MQALRSSDFSLMFVASWSEIMARITVRNLDDNVLRWLRERGAARGVSMEQEARDVLAVHLGFPTTKGFDRSGLRLGDSAHPPVENGL
jgi:hypothetical protein